MEPRDHNTRLPLETYHQILCVRAETTWFRVACSAFDRRFGGVVTEIGQTVVGELWDFLIGQSATSNARRSRSPRSKGRREQLHLESNGICRHQYNHRTTFQSATT
jgi:hypothetical protein